MLHKHETTETQALKVLINKSKFKVDDAFDLIKNGANPNVLNESGISLLHILVKNMKVVSPISLFNNSYHKDEIKELVVNLKADINVQDAKGNTPLQYLMNKSLFSSRGAMFLIKIGANPNVLNKSGVSLLHVLVNNMNGTSSISLFNDNYHDDIKQLVTNHKANINIQDNNGHTPLYYLINKPLFSSEDVHFLKQLGAVSKLSQEQKFIPGVKH